MSETHKVLVTDSLADYAQALRTLCTDRPRLAQYKQHLDSERERLPLFATAASTRAFERFLEDAANGVPRS